MKIKRRQNIEEKFYDHKGNSERVKHCFKGKLSYRRGNRTSLYNGESKIRPKYAKDLNLGLMTPSRRTENKFWSKRIPSKFPEIKHMPYLAGGDEIDGHLMFPFRSRHGQHTPKSSAGAGFSGRSKGKFFEARQQLPSVKEIDNIWDPANFKDQHLVRNNDFKPKTRFSNLNHPSTEDNANCGLVANQSKFMTNLSQSQSKLEIQKRPFVLPNQNHSLNSNISPKITKRRSKKSKKCKYAIVSPCTNDREDAGLQNKVENIRTPLRFSPNKLDQRNIHLNKTKANDARKISNFKHNEPKNKAFHGQKYEPITTRATSIFSRRSYASDINLDLNRDWSIQKKWRSLEELSCRDNQPLSGDFKSIRAQTSDEVSNKDSHFLLETSSTLNSTPTAKYFPGTNETISVQNQNDLFNASYTPVYNQRVGKWKPTCNCEEVESETLTRMPITGTQSKFCTKDQDFEPEWDYALDPFYTDEDYEDFNIYSQDPFLFHQQMLLDKEEMFHSNFYNFSNLENIPYFNSSNTYTDDTWSVEEGQDPNQDATLVSRYPQMGPYYAPYYHPYFHEMYVYQDILRQFALWSLHSGHREPFTLDDKDADDNEDKDQGAWFDRNNQTPTVNESKIEKNKNLEEDIQSGERLGPFGSRVQGRLHNPPEEFQYFQPQPRFRFSSSDFQIPPDYRQREQLWNNRILKAREMHEKNSNRSDVTRLEGESGNVRPSSKQNLNLIKSEITKIESKYRNRIHRVNDVYLEDIKEDANESKEDTQPETPDITETAEIKNDHKYIQINLSNQELNKSKFINELKIIKPEMEDRQNGSTPGFIVDSENVKPREKTRPCRRNGSLKTSGKSKKTVPGKTCDPDKNPEKSTQLKTLPNSGKLSLEINNTETTEAEERHKETLQPPKLNGRTNKTSNMEENNTVQESICTDSTKSTKISSISSLECDVAPLAVAESCKEKLTDILNDFLPDLLPNSSPCVQETLSPVDIELELDSFQSSGRSKPSFFKSGSYSYSATSSGVSEEFEEKTSSLKFTRSDGGVSNDTTEVESIKEKRSLDSSIWSILGRFMGPKNKKEDKKGSKSKFKFGTFKNTLLN